MKDESSLFKTVKFQNTYKHNLHTYTFYFPQSSHVICSTDFSAVNTVLLGRLSHKFLQETSVSILRVGNIEW